jgi:hypothetical protein
LTLRQWVVGTFGAVALGLVPWAVWLGVSLPARHVVGTWALAWAGFDLGLAALFGATAWAAYRRSTWVGALASSLGTLLIVDAWFDVVLERRPGDRLFAAGLALLLELPAAGVCFWIAARTGRFLSWTDDVRPRSELAAAGERPAERDLVGVLEIPADGEPAREPRDTHPSP